MRFGVIGIVVAAVLAVLAYGSLFTVYPTQQALVLQFGEVKRAVTEPGLYFKAPFIQNVVTIDKRILDLDVNSLEAIASDQKRLVVDAFARYRIDNPVLFYQTVNNVQEGSRRLATFVQSAVRAVLADTTFISVVRDSRPQLMERIRSDVEARAEGIGIKVVDVRLRRADLPEANSQAIFRRMQTERQREATEIRAQGEEAARRIRATAERQAIVITAEANQESETIRGDGDSQRGSHLRRRLWPGPGVLRLLPVDAGLRRDARRRRHALRHLAGHGVLPLPERSVRVDHGGAAGSGHAVRAADAG